jgi:hypothetical protein
MHVKMVKMLSHGVEVERHMLSDRSMVKHKGKLVISDEPDQGRHRPSKIARIVNARGTICELRDVSLYGPTKVGLPLQAMSAHRMSRARSSATSNLGTVRSMQSLPCSLLLANSD